MDELNGMGTQEQTQQAKRDKMAWENKTDIQIVNRDGDWYYIECPDCHGVDVRVKKIFMCRDCGNHFSVYLEDGHKTITVKTDWGKPHFYGGDPALLQDERGDYGQYHGADMDLYAIDIQTAKGKLRLDKDLHDGKDGHGHEFYSKIIVVNLGGKEKPLNAKDIVKAVFAAQEKKEPMSATIMPEGSANVIKSPEKK